MIGDLLALAQLVLGVRVVVRLVATARGARIVAEETAGRERVSVVVPVLNEESRLGPCLEGLLHQGPEVAEILVVDGGSIDRTVALAAAYHARDDRIRVVDASPVPPDWNGKAWGLQAGLHAASADTGWLLAIDADVRVDPRLTRSLAAHATRNALAASSVATLQELAHWGSGLVHPSLLATLVYRYGSPGHVARHIGDVQANGQCSLFRREALVACDGFTSARASRCEDVTIARRLLAAGYRVGFYETDGLVSVKMYEGWRETWRSWPRSLTLRDQFSRSLAPYGLLEVSLMQALPLPLTILLGLSRRRLDRLVLLNVALAAVRLGILAGTARAYVRRPWSYWLSPVCDIPVAVQLWLSLARRRHVWRGRLLVDGEAP